MKTINEIGIETRKGQRYVINCIDGSIEILHATTKAVPLISISKLEIGTPFSFEIEKGKMITDSEDIKELIYL